MRAGVIGHTSKERFMSEGLEIGAGQPKQNRTEQRTFLRETERSGKHAALLCQTGPRFGYTIAVPNGCWIQ